MSALLEPATIIGIPGFTLVQDNPPSTPFELYALGNLYSEVIESLRFSVHYGNAQPVAEAYGLQLMGPNGEILYDQNTPPITKTDGSDLTVSIGWSRLGNDDPNLPMLIVNDEVSGWSRGWANVRLPEILLPPGSKVILWPYRGSGASELEILVSDGVLVTNRIESLSGVDTAPPALPPVTGAYLPAEPA